MYTTIKGSSYQPPLRAQSVMASNQKALLVSLGIGVGVAAVVAGGVYYIVSTDERKTVIKTSSPVSVEMRIPIKVNRLIQ